MSSMHGICIGNRISARRHPHSLFLCLPLLLVISHGSLFRTVLVRALSTSPTMSAPSSAGKLFVGFDLGTSGARISMIEKKKSGTGAGGSGGDDDDDGGGGSRYNEVYSDSIPWTEEHPYDDAAAWTEYAMDTLLGRAADEGGLLGRVASLCASGTSASCLLVDADAGGGKVSRRPRMYDYDVVSSSSSSSSGDVDIHGVRALELLDEYAPPHHTARARTGSLAKLLSWADERPIRQGEILEHQADYAAMHLLSDGPKKCGSGRGGDQLQVTSDWHNCLKLGYDVRNLCWPDWLLDCLSNGAGVSDPLAVLPSEVVSPGEVIGPVGSTLATKYGIPEDATVVGGTTDSNAAFFAAVGGTRAVAPGTAVTSLGSTLALKQLSVEFCEDASLGVYSHRFPSVVAGGGGGGDEGAGAWLVGGASNVGCAVLRREGFTDDELEELSRGIDPAAESPLRYYPLTKVGERFPIADGTKEPVLDPVPKSRADYLHGILQGISDVERDGFAALGGLGAKPSRPSVVWSCGGGARNDMWLKMRERRLESLCGEGNVKVRRAANTEASYGAAILAATSFD